MNEISEEQKYLLRKLKTKSYPPEIAIRRIWEFLREKPEDEPLDPMWLDIWNEYKEYAARYAPSGVTKEIDEIISSIKPTDDEIWNIKIGDDIKVVFLLGAGASAPSGIPTVDKLLEELWKRARKIGREDLDRLARWCNDRGITNIEDLLTAAYISNFAARNPSITALLDYFIFSGGRYLSEEEEYLFRRRRRTAEPDVSSISFLQDTLQTLFGLLTSTMISASPNPTHEAIVNFIKEHPNTSIITTNYDGCMDEALLKKKIPLKGTISGENEDNPGAVRLIKMHGSINWAYCDSCQDVREFDLLELKENVRRRQIKLSCIGNMQELWGVASSIVGSTAFLQIFDVSQPYRDMEFCSSEYRRSGLPHNCGVLLLGSGHIYHKDYLKVNVH